MKNKIKLALDIVMAMLFITFFNKNLISFKFHTVSGLVFGLFVIIHLILNRKWIVNITKRLFDKKIKAKTKFSYILSLVLLVSLVYIIVSGVMIMAAPNYDRSMFWKMVHFGVSYLALALIGVHIGLYWNWVMNMFKKTFNIKEGNKIAKKVSSLVVLFILIFGTYTMYTEKYFTKTYSCLSYVATHIKDQGIEGEAHYGEYKKVTFANVASTYGSIIAVFTIGTYYTDKTIKNKQKREILSKKKSA